MRLLEERIAERESIVTTLSGDVEQLSMELRGLKAQKYELIQSEAQLKKQMDNLLRGVGGTKDKIAALEGQLEEAQVLAAETQRAKESMRVDFENKLSMVGKDRDKLRTVEVKLGDELAQAQCAVVDMQEIKDKLEEQIKQQCAAAQDAEATLNQQIKSSADLVAAQEIELASIREALAEEKDQRRRQSTEVDEMRNLHAAEMQRRDVEMANTCAAREKDLNDLQDELGLQLQEARTALSSTQAKEEATKLELSQLKDSTTDEIVKLTMQVSVLATEIDVLQTCLATTRDSQQRAEQNLLDVEAKQQLESEETKSRMEKLTEAEGVAEASAIQSRASVAAAKSEVTRLCNEMIEKEADLAEKHEAIVRSFEQKLAALSAEYEEKEQDFILYKTKAFGKIDGMQNEIDMLQRKLYLSPEEQSGNDTIDLVRATVDDVTSRFGDASVAEQSSSHDHDSLAAELIAAKLNVAQMSSEVSALEVTNKRLVREAEAARAQKKWFGR